MFEIELTRPEIDRDELCSNFDIFRAIPWVFKSATIRPDTGLTPVDIPNAVKVEEIIVYMIVPHENPTYRTEAREEFVHPPPILLKADVFPLDALSGTSFPK